MTGPPNESYVDMYLGQESNWILVAKIEREYLSFWLKDGGKYDTEPMKVYHNGTDLTFHKGNRGQSWYVSVKRGGEALTFGWTDCKGKLRNWMTELGEPLSKPLVRVFLDVPPMMMVRHLFEGLGLAGQAADMEGGSGQRFQLLEVD